jgi:hypothetical protein
LTRICLIAGNEHEAYTWARNQNLEKDQYFFPKNESELLFKSNFHVLVIGTAGMNVPASYFEKVYKLALERGKIDRR